MIINYIFVAIISYLLGSFPFALWLVKIYTKKDLREGGSKNTGALNTLRIVSREKGRTMGVIFFLLAFILDASKAVIAIVIAMNLIPSSPVWAATLATFFAVLGHNYSIFLKLKGGRGAASLMGVMLYLDWRVFCGWLLIVLLFMIIAELVAGGRLSKKSIKHAISEQIIGRLIGEVAAVYWIYLFNAFVFYPVAPATILVLIAHKDRIAEQVRKIRNNTYFND
jgi:glycerol-3-phosphate acyltransferase PlsY